MWSQANTLTRSMSEHLQDLKGEYEAAAADNGRKAEMVEQLIDCFDVDKVVLEQVRLVCCRNFHLSALGALSPAYQETVLTLRTRLNCWLRAWNDHQKHRRGGLTDKTNTTGTNQEDNDKGKAKADPAQHLQDWLAEVGELPRYPEKLPDYSSIDPEAAQVNFPKPKIEKYSGPLKTAADVKKLNDGTPKDMLEYRTPARKVTDMRARHGSAPGPGVSLIAEGLKKERGVQRESKEG
jgi:hypothetical protein